MSLCHRYPNFDSGRGKAGKCSIKPSEPLHFNKCYLLSEELRRKLIRDSRKGKGGLAMVCKVQINAGGDDV